MPKLFLSGVATLGLLALAACADTPQDKLRQGGYDAIQAYNVAAPLAVTYEQSSFANPAIVAKIKADSAAALPLIQTLGADLQSGNVITALEVSATTAAIAKLESDTTSTGATK